MRLDSALVKNKLCESREEAKELIRAGHVLVDSLIVTKATREVEDTTLLEVTKRRTYVSRGGDKLEGAFLEIFGTKEEVVEALLGKSAIDIGSSTGGFTDCLLTSGVANVTAIDVGSAQFHPKVRSSSKVTLFENTDIRNFDTQETFDYVVLDVSFISLEKIFDKVISFGHSGSQFFLLIKPQFEVGKGNTKKGIVKDTALVEEILTKYTKLAEYNNLTNIQVLLCKITGGDGNQEYFLYGTHT